MDLVFPHTFVPWFRSVAPYIHAYRGKTFVVAMAGEGIASGKLNAFVEDLAILHAMGIKIVLVHGFRPQVSEQLRAKGHPERFSHGLRITDAQSLVAVKHAAGSLRVEIEALLSQGLPNSPMAGAQIRRFLILHKALEADDGELTRTNKVRRGFIGERYKTLVDALYSGAKQVNIKVDVTFEDGRKGTIEGDIEIRDLAPHPGSGPALALRKAS